MTENITVKLPDGSVKSFEKGQSAHDVALSISEGLARNSVAARVNGQVVDLHRPLNEDAVVELLTWKSDESHEILLHSTAHVMAQAVKRLYPQAKVTIGPALENRFYYDFDMEPPFTEEDLSAIEAEMKKIVEEKNPVVRREMDRDDAVALFRDMGEHYKVEIISDIPAGETVTVYSQGDFTDLCRGPHLPNTGMIPAFKLLTVAGAYWRGDQKNRQLSRIYGTAFPSAKELKQYLHQMEEAKKRDHRKLGRDLDLFEVNDQVGQGLALWYPKGAILRRTIEDYWFREHRRRGYQPVVSPHVGKGTLWETSGHLGFYKDSMYAGMNVEGQDYYIKPMNCPFHIMIYNGRQRSYRELPVRFAELGTVYRYELSGALHGLMRVRGFTQDDAHIFCTHEQLDGEVRALLDFSFEYLKKFGFNEFEVYLSTKPAEKFVGAEADWVKAEEALHNAMTTMGVEYKIDEGGGAFYGPKIDIKIKDAIGRVWQCTTIQFDFNEPERFDISYIGQDGAQHRPLMIHRAIMGSLERFIGILIEDTAGDFPLWLAPVQLRFLPIADRHLPFCREMAVELEELGFRVDIDERQEKIGAKIREAEVKKVPYMLIVGDKELEEKTFSLRQHKGGDQGSYNLDALVKKLNTERKF